MGMFWEIRQQLREYIDEKIRQGLARVWTLTAYSNASSDGVEDSVRTFLDSDTETVYPTRRIQHYGLRTRPPQGVLAVRLGNWEGGGNGLTVAEEDSRYGPGDLDEGEVALYNKVSGTEIRIDKDGNIKINAASGKDVIVNGGTQKVARIDDTAKASTAMATWMGQVESGISGAGGTPPSPPASSFNSTSIAKINSGADNFKG